MSETQINLTEQNQQALIEISHLTGKSQQELITSAIEELIKIYQHKKRLNLMQQARGIWQEREDLPNLEQLRTEFNRNDTIQLTLKRTDMITVIKPKLALEEFLKLPETEPASELLDGEIIQKPMPQGEHSRLQGKLCTVINQIAETPKIAYAFPELRCTFGGINRPRCSSIPMGKNSLSAVGENC